MAALIALAAPMAAQAQDFAPVAIVNDEIITGYDVAQRQRLIRATLGEEASRERALDELIDDRLRLQAARRAGIDPDADTVKEGFAEIARLNRRQPEQAMAGLRGQGVEESAVMDQVKAEVAWRNYIRARYGDRARVSEAEVERLMDGGAPAAAPAAASGPAYLLAEMRFSGADAMTRAEAALAQLRAGTTFSDLAKQASEGPSAAQGGDLGWVPRASLSPAAREAIAPMRVDRVSKPFLEGDEAVLLGLRGVREGVRPSTYTLAQLVAPVAAEASDAQAAAALQRAQAAKAGVTSCADVRAQAPSFSSLSGDVGTLTLTQMPGAVREAVMGLSEGQVSEPIRSNQGFHVIAVCEKQGGEPARPAAVPARSREQVENRLRAQALERYSRSLLRELRRDAVIERR